MTQSKSVKMTYDEIMQSTALWLKHVRDRLPDMVPEARRATWSMTFTRINEHADDPPVQARPPWVRRPERIGAISQPLIQRVAAPVTELLPVLPVVVQDNGTDTDQSNLRLQALRRLGSNYLNVLVVSDLIDATGALQQELKALATPFIYIPEGCVLVNAFDFRKLPVYFSASAATPSKDNYTMSSLPEGSVVYPCKMPCLYEPGKLAQLLDGSIEHIWEHSIPTLYHNKYTSSRPRRETSLASTDIVDRLCCANKAGIQMKPWCTYTDAAWTTSIRNHLVDRLK